jgi:hypothetical protein
MLRTMLTRITPALAILLAACGPAGTSSNESGNAAAGNRAQAAVAPAGWTSGRDQHGPHLQYSWGDPSGVLFAGICEGHPVLLLDGGDYAAAPAFELLVDDQRWELETYEEANGRALFVDDPLIVDRIANARQRIAFRVGTWSRELRPDPAIAAFVRDCQAASG